MADYLPNSALIRKMWRLHDVLDFLLWFLAELSFGFLTRTMPKMRKKASATVSFADVFAG